MKRKIFITFISLLLTLGCINQHKDDKTVKKEIRFKLNADNIGCIKIMKDGLEFKIVNKSDIDLLIKKMNSSMLLYVKSGLINKFSFRDLNDNIILYGSFMDSLFKVEGRVYKYDDSLFLVGDRVNHY